MLNKWIFAFDARANGYGGRPFAAAACVIAPDGGEVARFAARCPIDGPTEEWVAQNVLPVLGDLQLTHGSYGAMLEAFWSFYLTWGLRELAEVIVHDPFSDATTLLRDVLAAESGREWLAPDPLLDVATALRTRGHDPKDLDGYNRVHQVEVQVDVAPQHPLHRAAAAARCWWYLHTEAASRRKRFKLAGETIELGTGDDRLVVEVVDWYRAARGHGIHDETDPLHEAAVREYKDLWNHATNGREVLCIGPNGEPLVFRSTQLNAAARARTGNELALLRRDRDAARPAD